MNNEPKLQAPGAGLPLIQRLALKLFVGPFQSKMVSWEESRAKYERLTSRILTKSETISAVDRKIKVLVKPIIGLEDSSRYWSVDMLLEHLLIVGTQMEVVILMLASGSSPDRKVDIAKVKPTNASSASSTQDILAQYKRFAPGLMERLDAGMKNKNSLTTLHHPWFGPINARQWYWLASSHQAIHWEQLKQIAKQIATCIEVEKPESVDPSN